MYFSPVALRRLTDCRVIIIVRHLATVHYNSNKEKQWNKILGHSDDDCGCFRASTWVALVRRERKSVSGLSSWFSCRRMRSTFSRMRLWRCLAKADTSFLRPSLLFLVSTPGPAQPPLPLGLPSTSAHKLHPAVVSASEMTCIVSGGALNSTHSVTVSLIHCWFEAEVDFITSEQECVKS